MVQYTQAQKLAYYKRKAQQAQTTQTRPSSYGGRGAYYGKSSSSYHKAYKPRKIGKVEAKANAEYNNRLASVSSSAGASLGGAIGSSLGGPLGGLIGSGLGTLGGLAFAHFTGKGDYKVVNNAFLKGGQMVTPIINKHKSGGDVFRRCEYLGDIVSAATSNTFNLQSFDVNPGLESTFQWLSQVAANYEEYEFEGLYFEYRAMSGDALNSVNTALGQVIMAANYNAASPNFTNKQSMENYEGGVSCKPSISMRYFVECSKSKTILSELYVRGGGVPAGQDQRLYDLCNFQIATNGLQGISVNCGELWACYQVCLRKPKLFSALGLYNSWVTVTPTNGTFDNNNPFGNTGTWNIGVTNTLVGFSINNNSISWSPPTLPQSYMVMIEWIGTAVAVQTPTGTASNGLTRKSANQSPVGGTTSTNLISTFFLVYQPQNNPTNANPTYTLSTTGVLPTTPGQALNFYIVQIPNTVYGI